VEKQHVLVPGRRDGNRWISRSKLRDDDLMHFRPIASFDSSFLQYPAPGELGITSLSCLSCPLRSFPSVSPKTSCKTANPLRLIYRSHGSYITFGRPLSTALNTKHQPSNMTGEDFVSNPSFANETSNAYFEHASGVRVDTNAVLMEAIRREYPQLHLTVTPVNSCNLLAFAASGKAAAAPIDKENDRLYLRDFAPPLKRLSGDNGRLVDSVKFGKFLIDWEGKEYVVYIAEGRDGQSAYPVVRNQYVLSSSVQATEKLLLEAGRFTNSVEGAVLVFDQGYWQKSYELWESIQGAEWSDVILDEDMKKDLIKDIDNFFDGQDTYQKLKVPWKRGVIYYGKRSHYSISSSYTYSGIRSAWKWQNDQYQGSDALALQA
jgi:hypothetical protein